MILHGKYKCLFIDTCIWIYFLEGHEKYGPLVKEIFEKLEKGKIKGIISAITFTEILTGPFRMKNDPLVHEYYMLISLFPNLEIKELTLDIAVEAARIRAEYNFATPDSLLLASALSSGADAFLTNDKELATFTEIEILLLDDYL